MNKIKIILFVWPIVLLLGIVLYVSNERRQIDHELMEPDGMVWATGEKQFTVHLDKQEDGELLHIGITIIGPGNEDIFKIREIIDRDMFGGGFVRAVQADDDPEKEIVVWHARAKYYLDFKKGRVEKIPFDRVPQMVKALAENWRTYNIMAGVHTTLLILFLLCYYLFYFFVNGILYFYNQKKQKGYADPTLIK